MGFISFILTVILVVWALGLVGRLLLRLFVRKAQRNFERQFGNGQTGGYYRQYTWGSAAGEEESHGKEGDVSVKDASQQKKINDKVGDYVDFEEV